MTVTTRKITTNTIKRGKKSKERGTNTFNVKEISVNILSYSGLKMKSTNAYAPKTYRATTTIKYSHVGIFE